MPIPNRQLKENASKEIMKQTNIVYEGPEGLIIEAKTLEAKNFWSNGHPVTCHAESMDMEVSPQKYFENNFHDFISKKHPMLIELPFTKDPDYSKLSAHHNRFWAGGGVEDLPYDHDIRKPLQRLLTAATQDRPDISILLYEHGILPVPEPSWTQKEVIDYVLKREPDLHK